MSKRSAEILDSILKKIEDMPLEEKKKLNTYIEELHNFDYNFSIDYDISSNIKYQEELSEMKDDFYFAA